MNTTASFHFTDARKWFHSHRLGIFIHWGIYSVHGIHEQEQWRLGIPASEYEKLVHEFNPVNFNPAQWLDQIQGAGFEYIVFTVKHHDGFCMWNTPDTDYNIMNTPYQKDLLRLLADECHKRNFPLELYYSCVDWHHPAYPNLGRHHEISTDPVKHDMNKYMDFLKKQIRQLCTEYAPIHGIWWDMNVPKWQDPSVNDMIRQLQPWAVINNRGYDKGDYATPERNYDPEGANPEGEIYFSRATEACQSISALSWGYRTAENDDSYSVDYFKQNIDLNLSRGGNYLLNIGPAPDGTLPKHQYDVVAELGKWIRAVRESYPENGSCGILNDPHLLTVKEDNVLYVHCPYSLQGDFLSLAPITDTPKNVILLNTGSQIDFTNEETIYGLGQGTFLRLRHIPRGICCPVFKIVF